MSEEQITIPATLVRYLRRGVQSQLSARVDTLSVVLEGRIDESRYRDALGGFDAARALMDEIGVSDEDTHDDIELDLGGESGQLVLKSLDAQHRVEATRLEDAAAHGVQLPERDVPELGRLLAEVRKRVRVSEAARRADALLESRGALGVGRSRDHG